MEAARELEGQLAELPLHLCLLLLPFLCLLCEQPLLLPVTSGTQVT